MALGGAWYSACCVWCSFGGFSHLHTHTHTDLTPQERSRLSDEHGYSNIPSLQAATERERGEEEEGEGEEREEKAFVALANQLLHRASNNQYEDAELFKRESHAGSECVESTPAGTYDNPGEVFSSLRKPGGRSSEGRREEEQVGGGAGGGTRGGSVSGKPPVAPRSSRSSLQGPKKMAVAVQSRGGLQSNGSTTLPDYSNQDVFEQLPTNHYDTPVPSNEWSDAPPNFDDTIYAARHGNSAHKYDSVGLPNGGSVDDSKKGLEETGGLEGGREKGERGLSKCFIMFRAIHTLASIYIAEVYTELPYGGKTCS